MPSKTIFRVHPTLNVARFGTSDDYILAPETAAGAREADGVTIGGLPIKAGTENELVTSSDLRDAGGHLKKQAARFRLFWYDFDGTARYPGGDGSEVVIGTKLPDGRKVVDLVWTVHLANKKAAAYNVVNNLGIKAYADGQVPQRRNPEVHGEVDSPSRLNQLMIDAGPRAISAASGQSAKFDNATTPSAGNGQGAIESFPDYPVRFPADVNDTLFEPTGPLDTLGEIWTDDKGRLIVLPSIGNAVGQYDEYDVPIQITGDLNNVGWYDAASDGPVSVTLQFDDGTTETAFGAWVNCCDPGYAPQIRNVVSTWDDVYDTWVRELGLQPDLFGPKSGYNPDYEPVFDQDIKPIFGAAAQQRWTANLPEMALRSHTAVDAIDETHEPNKTIMAGLNFIRNPNADETNIGTPLMPLSLGEAGTSFLTVSKTQYFMLAQWSRNKFQTGPGRVFGPGEQLDIAALTNCLGGRYVPGIEFSYIVRSVDIYIQDWQTTGAGPFRVKHKPLDYSKADEDTPFLTGGWIPLHGMTDGLEPGDLSKFMAIPWQTDYNSCSIHQTLINTNGVNESNGAASTLYWSWPSQRPDAVYVAEEVVNNVLPAQRWSIRGPGTYAVNPASAATFQNPLQSIEQWDRIGIVMQGSNIDIEDRSFSPKLFLEVQGQLTAPGDASDPVAQWPFNANPSKKERG
ncbi:MAG: LodA/GoxA family CTQ-dependent oxidase [Rhodobacter sp.]|nr:LodA/GoxA family CTQ-dependent oxidase [Rhodobacter sp.]